MFSEEEWGSFFKNKNLVLLVDALAERYGVTPIDILKMPLYEFNLASAILVFARDEEAKSAEQARNNRGGKQVQSGGDIWSKLGIKRTVVKKKKKGKKKGDSHGS